MTTAPKRVTYGTNRSKKVAGMGRRDGFYRLVVNGEEQKYASVTTILGVINKPALVNWAAKTAANLVLEDPYEYNTAEKAAGGIYGARDKAASRGSTVHSAVESILYGNAVDSATMPEKFRGYVAAFGKFCADHIPAPEHVELTVYNTVIGYAGTTDFLGTLRGNTDERWLLDWKTGLRVYDEAGLQVRAYRECDIMLPKFDACPDCLTATRPETCATCFGTARVKHTAGPVALPHITRAGIVLLRENGSYIIEEPDAPLEAFLAAKRLWEWSKGF